MTDTPIKTVECKCTKPCGYNDFTHSCWRCGYLYHPAGIYRRVDGVRTKIVYVQKKETAQ